MTTDVESFNRNAVPLDEKNTLNVVRDEPRDVPVADILDAPLFCLKFNEDWRPHITGAIDTLSAWKAWNGNEDETNTGTIQIWKLLAQDMTDCGEGGDCPTIPELIVEGDTFETEYAPVVFGEYWSQTIANETTLASAYDTTPQSIGADIPTGTPEAAEINALCAAINRFVSLYTSTKLCLIQSKNFLEILWTKLAAAANEFYEVASALMSPIYSPNIFSCFVSDAAAITALQDDSAIETLACFLYDELKTVTMSQSNFDNAISDAASTLTGDAADIACLMLNDNNLSLYINMLESYQISLQSSSAECPCETSTYWRLYFNFNTGNRYGTTTVTWNGAGVDGAWSGNGYSFVSITPAASSLNVSYGLPSLGGSFVLRGGAVKTDRLGSDSGGNDFMDIQVYAGDNFTALQGTWFAQNSIPDGDNQIYGVIYPSASTPSNCWQVRSRVLQYTDATPAKLRDHEVVFWGLADGSGNKPPLAQWVGTSLPSTVAGLFP